ncbi:polysaccharide deacetylase family protein [Dokdonella koreensis]|uniref:Polysaccharide deacetylase n=1 Tax=Dokdonella koreensis DS-123 TaxID=1300342 RepID=A0A167GQT0_9GAMM|nr:polysaccharide deacetylase family protein [Dokdonella koreensis]ANB17162.1 Polysaccharide deacetylase [Dokdonella koreensis DS-123]
MNWLPNKQTLLRLLPDSLALTRGPTHARCAYLTFDDGPNPQFTPPLLDLLARYGAHGSFFLIGDQIERYPAIVERIVAEGHLIGNHSYSHPQFDRLPLAGQLAEIERTDRLLERFDGRARHRFRTPRGVAPARLLLHLAKARRGITYWSYDSLDYDDHPVPMLCEALQRHGLRNGEIVLMHDDSARAQGILEQMLPRWRDQGIALHALPEEPG